MEGQRSSMMRINVSKRESQLLFIFLYISTISQIVAAITIKNNNKFPSVIIFSLFLPYRYQSFSDSFFSNFLLK